VFIASEVKGAETEWCSYVSSNSGGQTPDRSDLGFVRLWRPAPQANEDPRPSGANLVGLDPSHPWGLVSSSLRVLVVSL
jgi:hypothetical protein